MLIAFIQERLKITFVLEYLICCLGVQSVIKVSADKLFPAEAPLPAYARLPFGFEPFQFHAFESMTEDKFKKMRYGFPPGIYGSSFIPLSLWHHSTSWKKKDGLFMQPHRVTLWDVNYAVMISSCRENYYPRCSWHYFLQLMYQTTFNEEYYKLRGRKNIFPILRGGYFPIKSLDHASAVYMYIMCNHYRRWSQLSPDLHKLCPNPCLRNPCNFIKGAAVGTCSPTGYGIDDYTCRCEQGFHWEVTTQSCQKGTACLGMCNNATTEACISLLSTDEEYCKCKPGYTGHDCRTKYDACLYSKYPSSKGLDVGPIQPSGYEACGLWLDPNNRCLPVQGTFKYVCNCGGQYTSDLSLPYENCLKPLDSCAERICVHGECVGSPNYLNSICECHDGWTGSKCDQPLGRWSEWSEWTKCHPPCGPAAQRQRLRICLSGNETNCTGPVEQVRGCKRATDCAINAPLEEEIWLEFLKWSKSCMIVSLSCLGGLLIFLSLTGTCKMKVGHTMSLSTKYTYIRWLLTARLGKLPKFSKSSSGSVSSTRKEGKRVI
ncbi:unnamed protein product [Calicophoron daubneyi]|uniref:EGF-like domain-containing protein n=1 Tax=Calicophoron daubneyi TaxID=300641 RepID=A0AAV2T002_CALDB